MPSPNEEDRSRDLHEDEKKRDLANLVMLAFFVAIVGLGIWLADVMVGQRKADDCLASGRRNCAPIEVPVRER